MPRDGKDQRRGSTRPNSRRQEGGQGGRTCVAPWLGRAELPRGLGSQMQTGEQREGCRERVFWHFSTAEAPASDPSAPSAANPSSEEAGAPFPIPGTVSPRRRLLCTHHDVFSCPRRSGASLGYAACIYNRRCQNTLVLLRRDKKTLSAPFVSFSVTEC